MLRIKSGTFYLLRNANDSHLLRHTFPCFGKSSKWPDFVVNTPVRKATVNVVPVKSTVKENDQLSKKLSIPFSRTKRGTFFQEKPQLGNQFLEDVTLQAYLKRYIPPEILGSIWPDLTQFGERVATDLFDLSRECEENPPQLRLHEAWGKRTDQLITCDAWKKMKAVSAEEGLISIAYERKHAEWSRLYQMSKLYLYSPSSGLYSCPLAMTDGAARSLEVLKDNELMTSVYTKLISRDPEQFWTSGQWMTERKGGTDVAAGTETVAVEQPDGNYRLYGYKWFTSATDSDMALTLARVVNSDGGVTDGTKGLSMFYLETFNEDGSFNNIEVQRLKDKLGTRQLPTAELLLDGTYAKKVSEDGRGVPSISNMLILTRLHNAMASASAMRRIVNLARDYSHRRVCFGKTIKDHALHVKNLSNMEMETRAATLMMLDVSRLLGHDELGLMTDNDRELFRVLTPVSKLYTAKQAMKVVSEGLECFGGMGYLEDTGLPQIFRDAQVLPIWEGTTNILSLDVLRALDKSRGKALTALQSAVSQRLDAANPPSSLTDGVNSLRDAAEDTVVFAISNPDVMEVAAREFAYGLARIYMGMLLVEHASWADATEDDVLIAKRWCHKDLTPFITEHKKGSYTSDVTDTERHLVFAGYKPDALP